MKNGLLKPARVIDLSGIARLRAIEPGNGQGIRIGSAVTARRLELDRAVRAHYLSLAESGALVGSVQIRKLATLGGNPCNAAPSADMAPPIWRSKPRARSAISVAPPISAATSFAS